MTSKQTRRHFLHTASAGGSLLALGDLGSFLALSPATAADAKVTADLVRFTPDIEPIVRLIEETPREKCFPAMVEQLHRGLPYRQFLAALFLAGIRNVNPQPPGFKFHCVFVIHAAHQLSLDAAPEERLLPLFFALDNFKESQEEDRKQGDFRLESVQGKLPSPEKAWSEFHAAMDDWDIPRADRAIAILARTRGAHEIIEGLWRYGARDYRNIGHKAIFVANAWRTLETIGWQHAEPTLRSLVRGLLDFGKSKPVNGYAYEDQAYLLNHDLAHKAVGKLPGDWAAAQADEAVTREMLDLLREGRSEDSSKLAISLLTTGKGKAGAMWDTAHLASGELMMRRPGIFGLHTVTSLNALHYAFRMSVEPETRLVLLLQGLGWMSQFRNFMGGRGLAPGTAAPPLKNMKITELPAGTVDASPVNGAGEILATLSRAPKEYENRAAAAAVKAFRFAQEQPDVEPFLRAARRLVITRATDAHDLKYPAAIFEDYRLVSAQWRPHLLATAVYYLYGNDSPESPVMRRAREAVGVK